MSVPELDLSNCDREPIHIPGSIQPHGLMLVVDPATASVSYAAGAVADELGQAAWQGQPLASLIGQAAASEVMRLAASPAVRVFERVAPPLSERLFDISAFMAGRWLVLELEPAVTIAASLLPQLEAAAAAFERTPDLQHLFDAAASEFRRLSGYDRVMVYRFLDDDAGVVVAESRAEGQASFLNHHFPATDIPKQARMLYVRNLVRVIPDVTYTPAPLIPAWGEEEPLDLSDSVLRSVSPVHLSYLKNMGVAASASISIVKDGVLWGLIACHHSSPALIPADVRAACRALAGGLSRQIKAREETDAYRERVRLRTFEDDIVALLSREGTLDESLSNHVSEIMRMLGADGVAVLRGRDLVTAGRHPSDAEVRRLAHWAVERSTETVFASDRLSTIYPLDDAERAVAAGLLAVTLSTSEPWIVLWFRAEAVEVVNWAGNPHKTAVDAAGVLTPRASFEAWRETVRGRARRWTIPEIEAASRLRTAVMATWQSRRIQDLNRQLLKSLDEKELLLRQKEFLVGEVNHRVQNSLQLVSSFLALQIRGSDDPALVSAVEEARRRISAVSLVHRRLYRSDQLETVDVARYVDELLTDLVSSMGDDWTRQLSRDLQPVMLKVDRAVGIGLVLTELIINANKYAYGGGAGPLRVILSEDRNRIRLTVSDDGVGRSNGRRGFGSRMMDALMSQLGGELEFTDNRPGTKATVTAPI